MTESTTHDQRRWTPVHVRVGDGKEHHVGNIMHTPGDDPSVRLPAFFRDLADEMERQDRAEAAR